MAASVLNAKTPYTITMWDFSWLERRWPGAGIDWHLRLTDLIKSAPIEDDLWR